LSNTEKKPINLVFLLKKIKIERYAKLKKYTKKLMKGLAKLTKVFSHFKRPKYFIKYENQEIERKKSMVQSSSKEYALKRPYVILCEVLSQLRHSHIVNYKRLYHKVLTHNYKKIVP